MKIEVMSHDDLEQFINQENDGNVLLIYIRKVGYLPNIKLINNVDNGIQFILSLSVIDNSKDANDKPEDHCISPRDANKIARMVKNSKDIDRIIVFSDSGESQSNGIAAALSVYYNNDITLYNSDPSINKNCYGYVLRALTKQGEK